MSELAQDVSEYPVSQWTADNDDYGDQDDGPTLTMTLPPLLLHQDHVDHGHHHSSVHENIAGPSPAKISSPCPLCSINNNKVTILFTTVTVEFITCFVLVLLSKLCHWRRLCSFQLSSL